MKEVWNVLGDLINNWNDPQTIAGAVIVAVAGIVIRYIERKKLIKKYKKDNE
mgnify:CR=1 FL=1